MLKETLWHKLIYLPHYRKNFKAQKGQTLNPKVYSPHLGWGTRSKTIQAINLGIVLLKFSGIKNKRKCIIFSWVYFSVGTWLGLNLFFKKNSSVQFFIKKIWFFTRIWLFLIKKLLPQNKMCFNNSIYNQFSKSILMNFLKF